ncbi:MAG: MtrB/PioB family outer membrane beta-barrel protein, partial [Pseudomonadales bacterium]
MSTSGCRGLLMALAAVALVPAAAGDIQGQLELGLGYVDESSYRYGKYSGLRDEGPALLADFEFAARPARDSDELAYWRLAGQRLGLNSRRFEAELGRQGDQRLTLVYQQIPRNLFDDGGTPFFGTGTGRLDLPPDWQVTGPTTT